MLILRLCPLNQFPFAAPYSVAGLELRGVACWHALSLSAKNCSISCPRARPPPVRMRRRRSSAMLRCLPMSYSQPRGSAASSPWGATEPQRTMGRSRTTWKASRSWTVVASPLCTTLQARTLRRCAENARTFEHDMDIHLGCIGQSATPSYLVPPRPVPMLTLTPHRSSMHPPALIL